MNSVMTNCKQEYYWGGHFFIVDILRIIGTLDIFLFHSYFVAPSSWPFIQGSWGVDLFLVVSGFTANIAYAQKDISVKKFFWSRVQKFYPLYLFTTMLGLLEMIIVAGLPVLTSIAKMPVHLLFLQTIVPVATTAFNGAAWYLSSLIWVSVLWFVFKEKFNKIGVLVITISLFSVTILLINYGFEFSYKEWFLYHSPIARFLDFLIGVGAGVIATSCKTENLQSSSFRIISIVLFCIGIVAVTQKWIPDMIFDLVVAFVLLCHTNNQGRMVNISKHRFLQLASAYSFYFYMFHYLILMFAKYFLVMHNLESYSYAIWFVCFMLTVMCCVGWKFIEARIHRVK